MVMIAPPLVPGVRRPVPVGSHDHAARANPPVVHPGQPRVPGDAGWRPAVVLSGRGYPAAASPAPRRGSRSPRRYDQQ